MADAGDSKSPALYGCEGSNPSSGTIKGKRPTVAPGKGNRLRDPTYRIPDVFPAVTHMN